MREIKFRSWDEKHNKFVYYVWNNSLDNFIFHTNKQGLWDYDNKGLQQYTGLKDKEGKDIYEGDIIEYFDFRLKKNIEVIKDIVKWLQSYGYCHEELLDYKDIKIIGNIQQNPELVKDQ